MTNEFHYIGATSVAPFNPLYDFSKWKEKDKSELRNFCYQNEFIDLISEMFAYDFKDTPHMDIWLLESILSNTGIVGWCMYNDVLSYGTVSLSGNIGEDGIPEFATVYFANGKSFSGKIGKDVVIMFNNKTHTPELKASQFAEVLTETDNSIMACVYNSRPYIAILTKSQKIIKSIKQILNQWRDGKPQVIASEDTINDLVSDSKKTETINLSDPTIMEKIQYLSKLHDDILRRGLTYYGIPINSSGKMAQLNDKEIDGYETYSKIYPNNRLYCRQVAVNQINEMFETDISVDFGLAFKNCGYEELPEDGEMESDINKKVRLEK